MTLAQVDTYYAHPVRDFAATDEALRIRRVGDNNWMTYKGPKIDSTTKTRLELELPIAAGSDGARRGDEIWQALGFCRVGEVSKQRKIYKLNRAGRQCELALDVVEALGSFVELEIVVAELSELDQAREVIADLAAELALSGIERRGYLELLLAR